MRSDRDKRTDTEKEIDDFLSQFETPADELSADYSSYLTEPDTTKITAAQTFHWQNVNSADSDSSIDDIADVYDQLDDSFSYDSDPGSDVSPDEYLGSEEKKEESEAVDNASEENEEKAPEDVNDESSEGSEKYKRSEASEVSEEKKDESPASAEADREEDNKAEDKEDTDNKEEDKKPDPKQMLEEYKAQSKYKRNKKQKKEKKSKAAKAAGAAAVAAEAAEGAEVPETPAVKYKRVDGKKLKEALFLKDNKDYDPEQGETYEKDGKIIKNKPKKFSFLKLLRDCVAVGLVFVLCGLIYALGCITMAPKYDYKDIYSAVDTSSTVYDDQGKQIDNVFYTENRKIVKYKDMPEDLINSFVAIEDKTFWKHHGFNWTRMIGAILSSLTGNGRISGTSTITQQLARNVYLADTKSVRSIKRKILEMYYASRIEHSLSKEEIIEAYLNTIYLGHGCYGVNAAAKTYFSKKVKNLDLIECAALAALPQSPDTYALLKLQSESDGAKDSKVVATEPEAVVTNDIAKERRQLTLDLMLAQNMITQDQHDEVYNLSLNDFIDPNLKSGASNYSYFHEYLVDAVIADLMEKYELEYADAERMVYTKGLKIYSTLDSEAQNVIAKEFQDNSNFPYVTAPRDDDGNLLNNDGEIALYKYDNFFDSDGDFTLSGDAGDVTVNSDGSVTINKDHKLHIYETTVEEGTDYSLEFKNYYLYDDEDTLYSIAGGYLNIPMGYKSSDGNGNVVIDASFFESTDYEGYLKIDGDDVIITSKAYSLSPKTRQPQAAMTIVGVGTGEVKAMAGGRQFGGQKMLNRALNPRQPGSSIKPLAVYGAALQKSYELHEAGQKWKYTDFKIDKQGIKGWGDYVTMHSSINDERCRIEGRYWPNNFNNSFSGYNTFKTAIQKSINTCAVKLELQVGSDYSVNQLKKFGLTTVQDDTSNPVNDVNPAALALGAMTEGVTPLEMSLAYAAFPGEGKVNTPICYYKVLDRDGNELLTTESTQSEALNGGVAWIMQEILKSVVSFNRYMYVEGVQPGGKTGTTNDQYDIWFDGFTPSYAASIWIGTDENIEMSSMSTPAAALWGKIINQIPNAKKGEYPKQPAGVITKGGEYFTKGTETGLSSYNDKEARKKAEAAARRKWEKEREKHKHLVKEQGHFEDVYEEHTVVVEPEKRTIVHHDGDNPNTPEDESATGWDEEVVTPAVTKTERVKTGQKWVVDVKEHYEYDKGWRDGDFKFKYDE